MGVLGVWRNLLVAHRDFCAYVRAATGMPPHKPLQDWRPEYNESRPHRSLGDLSHLEFKVRWAENRSKFASDLAQEIGAPQTAAASQSAPA